MHRLLCTQSEPSSALLRILITTAQCVLHARSDLLSRVFPPFGTLLCTLLRESLTNATAASQLSRILIEMCNKHECKAVMTKQAPFLLVYALRCSSTPEARAGLNLGLRALVGACGSNQREAALAGLLRPEEEAERAALKILWQAWERNRYKGED